jgi:hypothetical protein
VERGVDWRAVAIGFAATALAQAALVLALLARHPDDLVLQTGSVFTAVLAGGFVAGQLAGRNGSWNGMLVAVVFILAGALSRSVAEQPVARLYGGPLHMGGVILADVVQLAAGTLGGWLARRN